MKMVLQFWNKVRLGHMLSCIELNHYSQGIVTVVEFLIVKFSFLALYLQLVEFHSILLMKS